MAKNRIYNFETGQEDQRTIRVWDGVNKKTIDLDVSFVPTGITIAMEKLKTGAIIEWSQLEAKRRVYREEWVKDPIGYDKAKAKVMEETEERLNQLAEEIFDTRIELTLKVLSLNGHEDITREWLMDRLNQTDLVNLLRAAPDIYLDVMQDIADKAKYEAEKKTPQEVKK